MKPSMPWVALTHCFQRGGAWARSDRMLDQRSASALNSADSNYNE
jgi:hypothetical protein